MTIKRSHVDEDVPEEQCAECGVSLHHVATDSGGSPKPRVAHHYSCRNSNCPADGGCVVRAVGSGDIENRLGSAVDPSYQIRRSEDGSTFEGIGRGVEKPSLTEQTISDQEGESHV